jgi:predicted transposase YbfD/YdcC
MDTPLDLILHEHQEAIQGFAHRVKTFYDPRFPGRIHHSLGEILLLVFCAQICFFQSLREYEAYGEVKLHLLRQWFAYAHGAPSRSTIARVLSIIQPYEIEKIFEEFIPLLESSSSASAMKDVIAIDGKTHRGFQSNSDKNLHIVSAFTSQCGGLTLGQEKTHNKSNEITAMPRLLKRLHLKGQVVTADAMGCQKDIASLIRTKQADYLLALKGNHPGLYEDVLLYLKDEDHLKDCDKFVDVDKGHGRIEERTCYVTDKIDWLRERHQDWKDLGGIVKIVSKRTIKGKTSCEERFYITSLKEPAENILAYTRQHWSIENQLHWMLDVVFREDDHIVWHSNLAHNESKIRRLALNVLKLYQRHHKALKGKHLQMPLLRKTLYGNDQAMKDALSFIMG